MASWSPHRSQTSVIRRMVGSMASFDGDGYATPEEAARGDIPRQFVTVVGTQIEGDAATVWLLTNDRPPFEDYEVHCVRERGRWHADSGFPFNAGAPDEVLERARGMGWGPIDSWMSAARLLKRTRAAASVVSEPNLWANGLELPLLELDGERVGFVTASLGRACSEFREFVCRRPDDRGGCLGCSGELVAQRDPPA